MWWCTLLPDHHQSATVRPPPLSSPPSLTRASLYRPPSLVLTSAFLSCWLSVPLLLSSRDHLDMEMMEADVLQAFKESQDQAMDTTTTEDKGGAPSAVQVGGGADDQLG